MNTQAEKLQLIEWLIRLKDQSVLNKIKQLKEDDEIKAYEASLKPMTKEELTKRAKVSEKAIEKDRVSDIESILNEDWD